MVSMLIVYYMYFHGARWLDLRCPCNEFAIVKVQLIQVTRGPNAPCYRFPVSTVYNFIFGNCPLFPRFKIKQKYGVFFSFSR